MKKILEDKFVIIVILIFIVLLGFFLVSKYFPKGEREIITNYQMHPKKYGINEYSVVNISEEEMAQIYLNNYKELLFSNIEEAYNLINKKYREAKFLKIEDFKKFVNNLEYGDMIVDRYFYSECDPDMCYYIYDRANNLFVFRASSVMEYEVFFDELMKVE